MAISIPLFIFSGYRVYGNFSFEKDPEVSRIQEITDTFGGISDQNTRDSLLFILKMEDFIRVIQPLTGDSIYGRMYLKT